MPHYPKPFFKASRGVWYVEIDRQQYNLGADAEEAFRRYHELMRDRPKRGSRSKGSPVLLLTLCEKFLDEVKRESAPRTYAWYQIYLANLMRSVPKNLAAVQLKPSHLAAVVDAKPKWSTNTKHGLYRAAMRVMSWAKKQRLITDNPLEGVSCPPTRRREQYATESDMEALFAFYEGHPLHDVLTAAWETGARPQEITGVEARHFDEATSRWVFPARESKGKKHPRVVYLGPKTVEVTKRLAAEYPSGKLFRCPNGRPWNTRSLSGTFTAYVADVGRKEMAKIGLPVPSTKASGRLTVRNQRLAAKYAPRISLYCLRHGYATKALKNGVDALTVATLLGHRDVTMLAKVYQHLAHDTVYLHRAADKARGACAESSGGATNDGQNSTTPPVQQRESSGSPGTKPKPPHR